MGRIRTSDVHATFKAILNKSDKECVFLIAIHYFTPKTKQQEIKCMFYKVENWDKRFLRDLERHIENYHVEYNTVRATERKILIEDQYDLCYALVQHISLHPESLTMDIYLSNVVDKSLL